MPKNYRGSLKREVNKHWLGLKGREIKRVQKETYRGSLLCEVNIKGKHELPYSPLNAFTDIVQKT